MIGPKRVLHFRMWTLSAVALPVIMLGVFLGQQQPAPEASGDTLPVRPQWKGPRPAPSPCWRELLKSPYFKPKRPGHWN